MSILNGIRSQYADYRFKKIKNLEISINNENNVIKANNSSPERFNVDKKIPLRSFTTLLSIGKNVGYNIKSLNNNPKNHCVQ